MYTLYQRDRPDAPDPMSMFWYNANAQGGWFVDLPLDHQFPNTNDSWVSMRSSWTDTDGVYVAMKGGNLTGHQTHGHLDAGDFVLDAMGERWAGQLCQANYLGTGYFSSEAQNSQRWDWYRTRTEGQNTIFYNEADQTVTGLPTGVNYGSTGDKQDNIAYEASGASTAFWTADLASFYGNVAISRGVRLLNGRSQILIQDEITNAGQASQWRMHTNATISYSNNNRQASPSPRSALPFADLRD